MSNIMYMPKSFEIADEKIASLLKRLAAKRVCPCCTARALTSHAAAMTEHFMGSAGAIEVLEEIILAMRGRDVPAPDSIPSTEAH